MGRRGKFVTRGEGTFFSPRGERRVTRTGRREKTEDGEQKMWGKGRGETPRRSPPVNNPNIYHKNSLLKLNNFLKFIHNHLMELQKDSFYNIIIFTTKNCRNNISNNCQKLINLFKKYNINISDEKNEKIWENEFDDIYNYFKNNSSKNNDKIIKKINELKNTNFNKLLANSKN
jgi:hypothetical protein